MKSVEVRERLVETLGLDLVGPGIGSPHATEQLSQAPSRWYLTGFLVPIDAREEQKSDETANEGVDEMNEAGGTDDALAPEPPVARRAVFPSSMGLSLLVPKEAKELRVTIRWGDYKPLHAPGEDDHEAVDGQGMPQAWQRTDRAEEFLLKLPTSQKPAEREVPKSNGLKLALSVRPVRDIPAFAEMVPKGTRSVSLFLVNRRKPAPDILRATPPSRSRRPWKRQQSNPLSPGPIYVAWNPMIGTSELPIFNTAMFASSQSGMASPRRPCWMKRAIANACILVGFLKRRLSVSHRSPSKASNWRWRSLPSCRTCLLPRRSCRCW